MYILCITVFSPWISEGLGRTSSQYYCTLRAATKRTEDLSSQGATWRRQVAASRSYTERGFISI